MKKRTKAEILELLNGDLWTCPITGQSFSALDEDAIRAHKDKLIAEANAAEIKQQKEDEAARNQELTRKANQQVRKTFEYVGDVADLRRWIIAVFQQHNVTMALDDVKINFAAKSNVTELFFHIKIKSKKFTSDQLQWFAGLLQQANINGASVVVINIKKNAKLGRNLALRYKEWRLLAVGKLRAEDKEQLMLDDFQYAKNIKRIAELAHEISKARELIKILDGANETIRRDFATRLQSSELLD